MSRTRDIDWAPPSAVYRLISFLLKWKIKTNKGAKKEDSAQEAGDKIP